MRSPDFLIIGAMKAGTTSLWRDLGTHPAIYFPSEKEPGHLASDEVLGDAGRRRYTRLFRGAGPRQLCGEASTVYAKLPDVPGVPGRASSVAGSRLKVIYMVREPLARALSQHHHELASGAMDAGFDEAVRRYPRLIHYSRYAFQVRVWLEEFGGDRVRIVRFEDFVANRREVVMSLHRFLGVEPWPAGIDITSAHNATSTRPSPRGLAWRVTRSPVYRRLIRPLLSDFARQAMRRRLLPPPLPTPAPPAPETVEYFLEQVRTDEEELRAILRRGAPLWDRERAHPGQHSARRPRELAGDAMHPERTEGRR